MNAAGLKTLLERPAWSKDAVVWVGGAGVEGNDRSGKPLKVLSPAMRKVFGTFGGHVSIQRSPPRWVEPGFVDRAIGFLKDLD
jgi:hypothetical protein